MTILSQRNPNWASMRIGLSNLTIGRFGCTLTSLSMLSEYFNGFVAPPNIAKNGAWFTPDGLILWGKLNFPTMKFEKRLYSRDDAAITAALKDPNKGVLLEVADKSHWVLGLRKTLFGKDYVVADPWFGDTCNVLIRYKNITGAAVFARK